SKTVDVTFGITFPLSHTGLKEFWMQGPSGNVCFLFKASETTRLGIGGEAALFSFRRGTFQLTFPEAELQESVLSTVHLYIALRHYLMPRARMSPFFGAELGVLRSTGAEYKPVIDGVRRTYYDIPDIARLTGSVSAGLDYYIFRLISLQVQGRAVFVANDPNIGTLFTAHAGFKFAL
ncbi:MAG: hypothetical protein H6Q32_1342, partial [Bacteroidetes bacterium]|nr:hypothetical protein [Bacteroidota bacterium]